MLFDVEWWRRAAFLCLILMVMVQDLSPGRARAFLCVYDVFCVAKFPAKSFKRGLSIGSSRQIFFLAFRAAEFPPNLSRASVAVAHDVA